MNTYGLNIWSDNNFIIDKDEVLVNYKSKPSLLDITKKIRSLDVRGPIVLRFPHLIKKQINSLYNSFNYSIEENNYRGNFKAVFPLKVNQLPFVVQAVSNEGKDFSYGLEAGSKAELILAMSQSTNNSPITVNGFKDKEMITLAFIAKQSGHDITITIEGLGELRTIIQVAQDSDLKIPSIGLRVRLHSTGSGTWAKSAGMDAKFGLTATEILEATKLLRSAKLLDKFTMIHFHIGSQMEDIAPIKRALREAGNIYAELKVLGAESLNSINIGGGLAVTYAQHDDAKLHNYSIKEFSSSVIFLLREIMDAKGVKHPDVFTESGRFVVASHSVLIAPVLELFTQDYHEDLLNLQEKNPPLIHELNELYIHLSPDNCIEYLHDALDHIESLLTLFDLGYINLQDRSNAEILVHNIIKKSLSLTSKINASELKQLQVNLQERYLINASIFQSLPDYWGLKQHFPVMPIHHHTKEAMRAASIWDITCDSDGEIAFDSDKPLYLHDIDITQEDYFLGFFNVGAYQEALGMSHNLFTHPNEYTIEINNNSFTILNEVESKSTLNILDSIGYDTNKLLCKLKTDLTKSSFITEKEKSDTLSKLEIILTQNGYLRTIS
ncbi:MAG TPA: biosynthetic arginine decarboxylase [Sulfurimonas sp.]|nr:biosynthetic arginine decarboxylase [Sulfurimonas sp.]HIM74597.1 biosynthetic arginine decarboxylase [Campylobacterales bacterium]